ncbi:hypothetical protein Q2354_27900, partial [Escherichia coli]|nr:hypothetical protein [Escherichia coli]
KQDKNANLVGFENPFGPLLTLGPDEYCSTRQVEQSRKHESIRACGNNEPDAVQGCDSSDHGITHSL